MKRLQAAYFKVYKQLTGQDIGHYFKQSMAHQWLPPAALKTLQMRKLRHLLQHVVAEVPYYRQMFKKHALETGQIQGLDDLSRIPLLHKEDIQRCKPNLVAKTADPKRLKPSQTGGSTGKGIQFYLDADKQAAMVAARLRGNTWIRNDDPFVRSVYLWAMSKSKANKVRWWQWAKSRAAGSLWLDLWQLNRHTVEDYVKRINRFNPRVLIGYSSALYMMALLMEEKGLRIRAPIAVISTAEVLTPKMRHYLSKTLSPVIFNRYGCREVGLLAMTCDHGHFHLNADQLIIEVVDDDGFPVKAGEEGKVVITDLHNYSMPFIRYVIEDIAVKSNGQCSCGRGLPLLQQVTGRTGDVLIDMQGEYVHISRLCLILEKMDAIERFNVHQKMDKSIDLIIKPSPGKKWHAGIETDIRRRLNPVFGKDVPLRFSIVDQMPLKTSGKFQFIYSDFDVINRRPPGMNMPEE